MASSTETEFMPTFHDDTHDNALEELQWQGKALSIEEQLLDSGVSELQGPLGLSGSSRDPRQAPAQTLQTNQRDPRQSNAPRGPLLIRGFQPLCLPQARPPQARHTMLPQLRPMADPLSTFAHNQQLKMRIKEALLAERKDDKPPRGLQPPPLKRVKLEDESQCPAQLSSQPEAGKTAGSSAAKAAEGCESKPVNGSKRKAPSARPTRPSRAKKRKETALHVSCFIPTSASAPPSRTSSPGAMPSQTLDPNSSGSQSIGVKPSRPSQQRGSTPAVPASDSAKEGPSNTSSRPQRDRSKASSVPPETSVPAKGNRGSAETPLAAPLSRKDPSHRRQGSLLNPRGSRQQEKAGAPARTGGSRKPPTPAAGEAEKGQGSERPQQSNRRRSPLKTSAAERRAKQAKTGKALQPSLESVTQEGQQVNAEEITIFGKSEYAADWEASSYFRLKDTSAGEAITHLRRDALSFAFPVAKMECPLQDTRKLDCVPLRPLSGSQATSSLPSEASASAVVPPSQLSEAQVELLARFRCSRWVDETAMPPVLPPHVASTPLKRRSARIRTAPASFIPFFGGRRRDKIESQEGKLQVGGQHQAELPACSKKPEPHSTPSADEASWLQHFVMQAGKHGPQDAPVPVRLVQETATHQRHYACGSGVDSLLQAADIIALGLDRVGSACAMDWTDKDVGAFERGLNECKRDFAQIASDHLPHKGPHLVGDFYYNVWKTKGIPEASAWYRRRDQERLQEEEAERLQEQRKEEAQAMVQLRRQIKDSLIWLKTLARDPLETPVLRLKAERVRAASVALARANVKKKAHIKVAALNEL